MSSKTTIEVNGKRYDAVTGAVIGEATLPPAKAGRSLDGFFRERPKPAPAFAERVTQPKPAVVAITAAEEPALESVRTKVSAAATRATNHARAHTPKIVARPENHAVVTVHHDPKPQHIAVSVNHTKHRSIQSSETLMRASVRRPQPSFYKQAGTVAALQHKVPSLIVTKPSVSSINADRLARAQSTQQSPMVAHHSVQPHKIQAQVVPIAVAAVPEPTKPGDAVPQGAPAPLPTALPPKETEDIFEQALMKAANFVDTHAHVRHFRRQTKRHLASMAAGTVALVVIAGFAAYQNTPGLQFKVASIQAGVSTNMPNLNAAGFAYRGASAHGGTLTVGFTNNRGDYSLTQQATNLSSHDMIDNIGGTTAAGHHNYVTVEAGDVAVYRFDNTSATWVKNGTWYTVSGNSSLSNDQVKTLVQNV